MMIKVSLAMLLSCSVAFASPAVLVIETEVTEVESEASGGPSEFVEFSVGDVFSARVGYDTDASLEPHPHFPDWLLFPVDFIEADYGSRLFQFVDSTNSPLPFMSVEPDVPAGQDPAPLLDAVFVGNVLQRLDVDPELFLRIRSPDLVPDYDGSSPPVNFVHGEAAFSRLSFTPFPIGHNLPRMGGQKLLRLEAIVDPLRGDVNLDGEITELDVIELEQRIAIYGEGRLLDFNDDNAVDFADRDIWIDEIYGTVVGDTDLDRDVDFQDFLNLSAAFDGSAGWLGGDFDGSGTTDFPDFLSLSGNFGFDGNVVTAVPEPSGIAMLITLAISFLFFSRLVSHQLSRKALL